MKKLLAPAIVLCTMTAAHSQTLFTYGDKSVDAKEFVRAYTRNNTAPVANKQKAMREYLDLYIASRLKIAEAYERGYDTLSQQKDELENLRTQILPTYLNDPTIKKKLVDEAYQRSLKDIHAAHIFVSFRDKSNQVDTLAAKQRVDEIYNKLKTGEDFFKVAQQYSEDPSARSNKGDLGFITVFTLPYEFENVIYKTGVGKISNIHRSYTGYHIFKNISERPAIGRMKAAQILLALPPGSDVNTHRRLEKLADSLYNRILKGDDFAKLASSFSNDIISASSGGVMQDFGIGQYDPLFEKQAFALTKNGAVSKPFQTSHGYHIIKRISLQRPPTSGNNKTWIEEISNKIDRSDRAVVVQRAISKTALDKAGFERYQFREGELWMFTDSIIEGKLTGYPIQIKRETPLFRIAEKKYTADDWLAHAQAFRYKADGTGARPYDLLLEDFIQVKGLAYYTDHLEDFNEDFLFQLNEFKDGNLFFEIMQREVWGRTQTDTAALLAFYEANKEKYKWNQSADAVIFFATDLQAGKLLHQQLKKDPKNWRTLSDALGETVLVDSGRYDLAQIPDATKAKPKPGLVTAPIQNKSDNSITFAYIINVYNQPQNRSFEQAKGMVINDYQTELDRKWVEELKKKYPVKVNEEVFNNIAR